MNRKVSLLRLFVIAPKNHGYTKNSRLKSIENTFLKDAEAYVSVVVSHTALEATLIP